MAATNIADGRAIVVKCRRPSRHLDASAPGNDSDVDGFDGFSGKSDHLDRHWLWLAATGYSVGLLMTPKVKGEAAR